MIVPTKFRVTILQELHRSHPGISHMMALARNYVWWPRLDKDIEQMVQSCDVCQQSRPLPQAVPLSPWQWPSQPWSRIHIDYCGPIAGHMILIIVDAHSKWIEAKAVKTSTTEITIRILRSVFATHGIPKCIVSDNGPAFASTEFEYFLKQNGIKHIKSAPYHPSSNGLAERAVQTVKNGLMKQTGDVIHIKLQRFLFSYRITPHSTTGLSPAELLMGRRLRSRLDNIFPSSEYNIQKQQTKSKINYDLHTKARSYIVGDTVYIKQNPNDKSWIEGIVSAINGSIAEVITKGGKKFVRHLDHIRTRVNTDEKITNPAWPDDPLPIPAVPEKIDVQNSIPQSNNESYPEPYSPPPIRRSTRDRKPVERYQAGFT